MYGFGGRGWGGFIWKKLGMENEWRMIPARGPQTKNLEFLGKARQSLCGQAKADIPAWHEWTHQPEHMNGPLRRAILESTLLAAGIGT